VVLAVLAVVLAAAPAAAQEAVDRFAGLTIVNVRLEVEGLPDRSAALLGQVETVSGHPLRPEDVRASIVKLYRVGQFDDITVLATAVTGGVDLLYAIVPRHPVDQILFKGATGLPGDALARLVRQQFGGAPAATRAIAAAAVVEQALKDEGYLRPRVDTSIVVTHMPDRATMVFDVDAGVRARLGTVDVTLTGRASLTRAAVISRTGAVEGAPYSPRAIGAALDAIVDELRQRNYYEASRRIGPPVVSADGATVNVELSVSSGPLYRIEFVNPGELPKGDPADLVPVKRQRSVDDDLLDDSERHIADLLRHDGYWHAEVTHTREPREDETVVTFTVRRGLRYRSAEPEVAGNVHLSTDEVMALLEPATSAFFDQTRLDRWRLEVLASYRSRGYAFADLKFDHQDVTQLEAADGFGHVRARLVIAEGPETHVGAVVFHTASAIPESELRGLMKLQPGALFLRSLMDADQLAIQNTYLNRGFRQSRVTVTPAYTADHASASLTVEIVEGLQTIVDGIVVVGNGSIRESLVLGQMALRVGGPYSLAEEVESRRRLAGLQLFRTFDFAAVPVAGSDTHVELIVSVEPAAATTIATGGGLSIAQLSESNAFGAPTQHLQFAPRASFDITRRNLFGRNRQLSITSSVTFEPTVSADPAVAGTGFSPGEYHFGGTYRAPQSLGHNDLAVGVSFEKAPRTTFTFISNTLHADLQRRTARRINIIARYSLVWSKVFNIDIAPADQLLVDRLFPQVRLSTFSGGIVRDRRDDLVDPSHGTFLSVEADLAARHIGSQVGFAKAIVNVSGFHQVGGSADRTPAGKLPRVVLAGRVELGLARGFGQYITTTDASGNPVVQYVTELPASERFFAGGSTTVRGFDVDQLGVPAVLDQNGLSIGGNGLLVMNGEVRTTVLHDFLRHGGDLGVVGFSDAGNVFAKAGDLGLNELLTTVGVGVRWKSPLGPLRVDYGFKLNPRTINGVLESRTGWSFSIGEAF
jgi:outer membrane protein insertion porin family